MISFLLSVRTSVRYAMVIIYIGCIMALSLLPPQDLPKLQLFRGADKVVHFMMYFIFSILFCWAIKSELKYYRLAISIPVTIGWGIMMEYLQLSMHAGRSFSIYDMLANSLGVFSGVIIYVLIARTSHS